MTKVNLTTPSGVTLTDGAPDLSDAYGVGVGAWDMVAVDRLYGAPEATEAKAAAPKARASAPRTIPQRRIRTRSV